MPVDRGCIHKKISGLEQKAKKVPRVFFKISVRGPKQKLGWGADAPPLLADFVNSLLIGNRPPWHLSLAILAPHTQLLLHSRTGATLAHATVKPESRVRRSLW